MVSKSKGITIIIAQLMLLICKPYSTIFSKYPMEVNMFRLVNGFNLSTKGKSIGFVIFIADTNGPGRMRNESFVLQDKSRNTVANFAASVLYKLEIGNYRWDKEVLSAHLGTEGPFVDLIEISREGSDIFPRMYKISSIRNPSVYVIVGEDVLKEFLTELKEYFE
ncbi:hypothetical protein A2602_03765 [candidate division WWE3 bacterium RIFOXYD1_FULL_40_11]|nr:MAG: hypothetical protein A3K58_00220 [candidate division WWE3 bacterium RIFOXYB1_FULL_40_22]OGC61318.1 MAG: hypothetical protein A3K37_00220 [candidate division WWE3 bacterium RIFOXYA1_FULL_40_11]OGC70908.1 MAG: hypothetical protein A2602_03765 [candidate division WWE3 bacterium RIFOXYD1_FULL_40_11]